MIIFLVFFSFFLSSEGNPDCCSKMNLSEVMDLNVSTVQGCSYCVEISYRNKSNRDLTFFGRDVFPSKDYLAFEAVFEDGFWFKYPNSSIYANPLSESDIPGYYDLITLRPYDSVSFTVNLSNFYLTEGPSCFFIRNELDLIELYARDLYFYQVFNSNKICL